MPKVQRVNVAEAAEAAASSLVTARRVKGSIYINLPLIYPGGGAVTVKIDPSPDGARVSDSGFAYRELESFGLQRSFANTAANIVEAESLEVDRRAIFVDVPIEELARAICDVGIASWQVADRITGKVSEEEEAEIQEYLGERLVSIFGSSHVQADNPKIKGQYIEWDVSAVVMVNSHRAVFNAVSNHMNSISHASTAFHDLANLEKPPLLVSVVKSKAALGAKFGLLSQAGDVIEEEQSDEVYLKAAHESAHANRSH
jgi:hypothetical protein